MGSHFLSYAWCATRITPNYKSQSHKLLNAAATRGCPAAMAARQGKPKGRQPGEETPPPSQAKTRSSQAKTKKRRPAADDPPTPGSNDPLLAELRETTTQRLATLLAQNSILLSDLGRLNSSGVDTGTVFGRALKRARGLETLVPPPPPEPERRPRPVKCAASLHTSVIVDLSLIHI